MSAQTLGHRIEGKRVDVPLGVDRQGVSSCSGPPLEVRPLPDRPGFRAVGEISVSTRGAWRQALGRLTQHHGDRVHVELAEVTFVDVGGVTDLAMTALDLPEGQRIVLHQPPPQLPRILDMFWPGLGAIEVAQ